MLLANRKQLSMFSNQNLKFKKKQKPTYTKFELRNILKTEIRSIFNTVCLLFYAYSLFVEGGRGRGDLLKISTSRWGAY